MRIPSHLALLIVLALVACGASARERTLHATFVGVEAAQAAFVAADAAHQLALVAGATSHDDGAAKLAAYRARREKLVAAIAAAYRAIAVAAILNDDTSLAGLIAAAKVALDEWRALQVELGGGAP